MNQVSTRKHRTPLARSLDLLRELGLEEWSIEFYAQIARGATTLPHHVVRAIVEGAARKKLAPNG